MLASVGDPDLSPADVDAIQQVLVDTGAVDAVEARITSLVEEAVAALPAAPVTPEARRGLADLAIAVAYRSR